MEYLELDDLVGLSRKVGQCGEKPMTKKWLALAGILLCGIGVSAQTGNDPMDDSIQMSQHLGSPSTILDGFWDGYIMGQAVLLDVDCGSLKSNALALPLEKRQSMSVVYMSIPAETAITGTELRAVIQKYISDHPTTLHQEPSITIMNALSESYPCVVTK